MKCCKDCTKRYVGCHSKCQTYVINKVINKYCDKKHSSTFLYFHHAILHSFDQSPGKSGDDKSPVMIFVTTGLCKRSIFNCSGEQQTGICRFNL